MIVPVVITAIVLFPFLLYIVFADETLIPLSIQMHELSDEAKAKKPVNPNIPHARGNAEEQEDDPTNSEQSKLLSLEEIMNPFLDKGGAGFGAVIMAATLVTILAINAASQSTGEHPVFYVTLPAAFVMFCWDITFGWIHREETRKIARDGRREIERARAERLARELEEVEGVALGQNHGQEQQTGVVDTQPSTSRTRSLDTKSQSQNDTTGGIQSRASLAGSTTDDDNTIRADKASTKPPSDDIQLQDGRSTSATNTPGEVRADLSKPSEGVLGGGLDEKSRIPFEREVDAEKQQPRYGVADHQENEKATLVSLTVDSYRWAQETFPTAAVVMSHLPFALVPFAFSMFVLVQALVTKGWVPVFAYGWDHWVNRTGTIGSVGGMGFLSVILCNVSFRISN
ncbi:hypothetical protein PC116_g29691 [Phytophthora cactorum]|nr:hypothetical protein PC116_g29691 [Phytophthora cactorum]